MAGAPAFQLNHLPHHRSLAAAYLCFALLTLSTVASAQSETENWTRCEGKNPDLSIRACTALIQSAAQDDENLAVALNNRGIAYDVKGQHDLAIADFTHAIQLKPDYAGAFSNRASAHAARGELDFAILDFNQAIQLKPDDASAFNLRGSAYEAMGQPDLAIADFSRAIQLKPDLADAYSSRGNTYADQRQFSSAIADYTQSLRLNPSDASTLFDRGAAYLVTTQFDSAIADFDRAIRLRPNFPEAFNNRGIVRHKMGQELQAIADFDQAIRLQPNYAAAYSNRCVSRSIAGRLQAALDDCNQALTLRAGDLSTLDSRGLVYLRMKNPAAALADYNAALIVAPNKASSLWPWYRPSDAGRYHISRGRYRRRQSNPACHRRTILQVGTRAVSRPQQAMIAIVYTRKKGRPMKPRFALLLALALLLSTIPAYAHHSFAAEFDGTKPVRLSERSLASNGPTRTPTSTSTLSMPRQGHQLGSRRRQPRRAQSPWMEARGSQNRRQGSRRGLSRQERIQPSRWPSRHPARRPQGLRRQPWRWRSRGRWHRPWFSSRHKQIIRIDKVQPCLCCNISATPLRLQLRHHDPRVEQRISYH